VDHVADDPGSGVLLVTHGLAAGNLPDQPALPCGAK